MHVHISISRLRWTLILVLLASTHLTAQHSPLLPHPQTVSYGSGHLLVRGLGICFGSPPSPEDRFTASELSRLLEDRAGVEIPVWEHCGERPALVLTRTGGVDPLPLPDETPGPQSRESYQVKITPTGGEVRGRSSAAVFYGVQTLRQLAEGHGDQASLPEIEIKDWPSLAYRGVMVDVGSEGVMCTPDEVKRQIDFASRWKANQYYFYNEASIELHGYPLLNPESRFTQDQVRQIVAFGRQRHVDVVPCLEMFGHLHDLFRIEKYSDLSDFPHGGEFNPENPKVNALVSDWVNQYTQMFSSWLVNIGFDETWELAKAAEKLGSNATPAKLFIEQLNFVARLFQQRGKRVMAWADIMVKFPDIVPQLPPGIIAGPWYYDPKPDPEYKRWLTPLVEKHIPHLVVTGVDNWNDVSPDFDTAWENIDTFLAAGRKSGALGLINTFWSDSNQNLLRQCWPGIAYGAIATWQSAPIERAHFYSDYAGQVYGAAAGPEVAAALADLSESETDFQKVVGNGSTDALWEDPFTPGALKRSRDHHDDLRQTRLGAESAQEHLMQALALGGDPKILESLLVGGRLLDYAGMKYIYAVEISDAWEHQRQSPEHPKSLWEAIGPGIWPQTHSRISDLMDGITGLRADYCSAWLAQNTRYRLGTALGRFDAEYEFWRALQARFQAYAGQYKGAQALLPLDSIVHGH